MTKRMVQSVGQLAKTISAYSYSYQNSNEFIEEDPT
jgi:hypothetical protein